MEDNKFKIFEEKNSKPHEMNQDRPRVSQLSRHAPRLGGRERQTF